MEETPPSQPPAEPAPKVRSRGKPFAISSLAIAGIGLIPLLVYLLQCLFLMARDYNSNPLLVLLMAGVGFFIHVAGLALGIVGMAMGAKRSGLSGIILNGVILALVLVAGFIGITGGVL